MENFLKKTKDASRIVANLSGKVKNEVLNFMAKSLEENINLIKEHNQKDLDYAKEVNLNSAMLDRLLLDDNRISDMAQALREIASLKEPVGRVLDGWIVENGLKIEKVSVPIGVIGTIYESRPNVTSDTAGLCFKSGNVALLKGGKEAYHSNKIIAEILQKVLEENNLPKELISLFPDSSRDGVSKIIKEDKYIDLIIPRGGEKLIKFICANSSIPVVKHDKGLCHTYLDVDCNIEKAISISINAKTQRVGVCNSMETLLIDIKIAKTLLPQLKNEFDKFDTELRGCKLTQEIISCKNATDEDFHTEYLDNILSIKIVNDVNDAVAHINKYSSGHSETIVTENYTTAEIFLNQIDSSCVYLNASTRFTDGSAFGFGAEVGISTNKLHARGPMGINDLTTYKYKIYGDGQIR